MELTPPKRRKTAATGGNWRATASKNLNQPNRSSAPARNRQWTRTKKNDNHPGDQDGLSHNHHHDPIEKSTAGDSLSEESQAFADFLQDLLRRKITGTELIHELEKNSSAMEKFIKTRLALNEFQPMMQILRKVCECDKHENKAILVARACQPEFLSSFPRMMVECTSTDGVLEQVAIDIVKFFATIATLIPLTAVWFKSTAQSCLSNLRGMQAVGEKVEQSLIHKYEEVLKDLLELEVKTPKTNTTSTYYQRRKEQVDKMRFAKPPNSFREIAIFPNKDDVLCAEPPFLRPNIVDGPYEDVEQYLDVQFRLLREDFVRPLREGVQDIMNNTSSRQCDSLSVRVYRSVRFLNAVREMDPRSKMVNEGVLLCFDSGSGSKKKKQNWEHSKRFLYGGLVCFTCNNFQTILFATISGRDLKYLEKGQILVTFCQPYIENIYNSDYIMIESEVFFEPYYQVLRSLQRLDEESFPMADYFIQIQKQDYAPFYLEEYQAEIDIEDIRGRIHSMLPLHSHTWPSGSELGLDPSQYQALQAALTKELVVIQGPPGTGKTFMALKIAGILIENKVQMLRDTPILVVCLTNHALDQFLVGMLKFTESIVRIGGQSKEERLNQFNLKNQRYRRNKEQYKHIKSINNAYKELEQVEASLLVISNSAKRMDASKKERLEEQRSSLINTISIAKDRIEELKIIDQVNFLKDVNVIGLTTNGAARLQTMLSALECEIVIVEEAAEVMESHIIACVSASCAHLILIGDHKQLRPNVSVYELGKYYNFDISLFERMVMNREGCVTLQVQHRMAPEIAKLIVPTIYEKLENHKSVHSHPNVRGMLKRLYFLSHSHRELQDKENSSRTNDFEANFLISLCKRLIMQGYKAQQITILAAYKGQMFLIKKNIKDACERGKTVVAGLQEVLVTVVDNYQGEENDIILLSLVRSNPEGRIGFLATENRVCVALSRARQGLFIIGNMDMLAADNKTWQAIKKSLQDQDSLGNSIPLRCEVHPDQIVNVASTQDFAKLTPYDGCSKICAERMNCGHNCASICHLVHFDHTQIKCQAPCLRKCDAGLHPCKLKCYVPCGTNCCVKVEKELPCGHKSTVDCKIDPAAVNCMVVVEKTFPRCNHTGKVACHDKICPNNCDRQAPCGHSCTLKCHIFRDPDHLQYSCMKQCTKTNRQCSTGEHLCVKKCYEACKLCDIKVDKRRSCGHNFKSVICHKDVEAIVCNEKCRKMLACGHHCPKTCKEDCYPCMQMVDKTRSCGHMKRVFCHLDLELEKCTEKCTKTLECGHLCIKSCNRKCFPCVTMVEKKIIACGHFVQAPCYLEPSRANCEEMKCLLKLKCGHPCTQECSILDCESKPCEENIEPSIGSCGHYIERRCFEKTQGLPVDISKCIEPCNKQLVCGHTCSGICSTCHQGRFHVPCKQKCGRIQICGHSCDDECGVRCSPCSKEHLFRCDHAERTINCKGFVNECMSTCSQRCKHKICRKLCGCSERHCKKQCKLVLPCTHQCSGFCGETCPPLCWTCDKTELMATAFTNITTTYPKDPRFIVLKGCGHVVETQDFEKWLQWQDSQTEIRKCPRCLQVLDGHGHLTQEVFKPMADWQTIWLNKPIYSQAYATRFQNTLNNVKLKFRVASQLAEEVRSVGRAEMTTEKLTQHETKVKVISIMNTIVLTLWSHGHRDVYYSAAIEEKVTFLMEMLSNRQEIWIQQTYDFSALLKELLLAVSVKVKVCETNQSSLSKIFKTVLNPFRGSVSKQLDIIDTRVSVSYNLLKESWIKCLNCKHLNFCSAGKCSSCGGSIHVSKPEFLIHVPV